jgi:hypothetical protein
VAGSCRHRNRSLTLWRSTTSLGWGPASPDRPFIQRLRDSRVATPAIYMSGYPGEMMAAVTGSDLHLSKPFATEELLRSVRQLIDTAHVPQTDR